MDITRQTKFQRKGDGHVIQLQHTDQIELALMFSVVLFDLEL
jgi:hypothetical protein